MFLKYNHKDTLFMISLYPSQGELYSAGASGLASYGKNVVSRMSKQTIILTDFTNKKEVYDEGETLIMRCFKKNSFFMWFQLLKSIKQFSAVKHVLIQYDFAAYGNMLTSGMVIPFLAFLKLQGYTISFVSHSVITDVFELSGHLGLELGFKGRIKGALYNILFHNYYRALGLVTTNIIVLEKLLKNKLSKYISAQKITVIPHGVDIDLAPVSKDHARKKLGLRKNDHIILFFGFVNWFKGADFFAQTFSDQQKILGKNVHAIIAGGISATMKDKNHYQKYFTDVTETVCNSPVVTMTGYVPQEDIKLYFSAADLVIFPYRSFMSASGVLSLLFSYQKPYIVSSHLGEMFDSPDFQTALKQSGLKKKDFIFHFDKKSCISCTEKVLKNGLKKKMVHMTKIMRDQRDYQYTAKEFEKVIFTDNPSVSVQKIALNNFLITK